MKKILLVPLMAISLLVGCNEMQKQEEEPIVTIQDWLSDNNPVENECKYFTGVGTYSEIDYGGYVANEILDSMKIYLSHPEKTDVEGGRALLTYHVKKECGPYTECYILVHQNCIEVESFKKYGAGRGPDQHIIYDYHPAPASSLIIETYKRYSEVKEIKNNERTAAEEVSKLENFYSQIEESATNPIATFSNVTIEDAGHSLLDDIKDLFTTPKEKSYSAGGDGYFMSYGLNKDFMLKFYLSNNSPVAVLDYKYQSSLGYTGSIRQSYSVAREKVDNLIKKITVGTY